MKSDFEEIMEGLSDSRTEAPKESGLPNWMVENLESEPKQEQEELPQWMKESLESKESSEYELTCMEILEGIFRDLFQRIFGEESTDTDMPKEQKTLQESNDGLVIEETVEAPEPQELTEEPEQVEEPELFELYDETSDTTEVVDRYELDAATDQWHYQLEVDSCANACQTFIINEYLDANVDEAELNELARSEGWYVEGGTYFQDIGNLLDVYGIENYRSWNADFQDVKDALDQGDRVIVCVYNAALDDDWGDQLPIASANHAVEVLGVDDSDPNDVKVIVNDPGVSDGCGKVVSLDTFNRARETSGGFMVVADRP